MSELFIKLFNMSIAASWVILAVVLLRALLRRAPKWLRCVMWAVVAVRLLCPFTIESVMSLIPSAEVVSPDIVYSPAPVITSGIPALNNVINPVITEVFTPDVAASANPLQIFTEVAAYVWLAGVCAMAIYAAVSYFLLRRRVGASVSLGGKIRICDDIKTPFILGVFRPRIYLPSDMGQKEIEFVTSHEKAHLRRGDHLWKPLGFALLSMYWFNPLCWVAYSLLCRDIELACDEKVISELGDENKKEYSAALLACSVPRKMITACPLAFGEVGVKKKVKSVLNYKKPAFWIIITAVVACVVLAVCFLTNPEGNLPDNRDSREGLYLACDNGADVIVSDGNVINMTPAGEVNFDNLTSGDRIKVEIDEIAETYPAQATVYSVELLADGEIGDINPDIIHSLTELGWLDISIDSTSGPFAAYIRETEISTLDVYIIAGGRHISVPYSLIERFPATDRTDANFSFGYIEGIDVYYGEIGDFRWAVAESGPSLGSAQWNYCTSSDGGATWQTGNQSELYSGVVTGAGFASDKVGFVCCRYFEDNGPVIIRTTDGGATWLRMTVAVPEYMSLYRMNALSPTFEGMSGTIPVQLYDADGQDSGIVYLLTADGGMNWELQDDGTHYYIDREKYALPPTDEIVCDGYAVNLKNLWGSETFQGDEFSVMNLPHINTDKLPYSASGRPNAEAWNKTVAGKYFFLYGECIYSRENSIDIQRTFNVSYQVYQSGDIITLSIYDFSSYAGSGAIMAQYDVYHYDSKTDTFLTDAEVVSRLTGGAWSL